jgi:hypothetical protein
MSSSPRLRLPISTRHAFGLAFDLAFRRDATQSLLVPLLLRSPWILALMVLPKPEDSTLPARVMMLSAIAQLGDFITLVLIGAMLRFRARSVFNTPLEVKPAPAIDCYAKGLTRVPWLIVSEIVRNLAIVFGTVFFVLPGVFLGFRLSFATEAVVLNEPNTSAAFRRSFHLTERRFERWFEMIVVSVLLVLGVIFASVILTLPSRMSMNVTETTARVLATAIMPVIQYAWTFFYLRLVEVDVPRPVEVGPLYAGAPEGTIPGAAGDAPAPASGVATPSGAATLWDEPSASASDEQAGEPARPREDHAPPDSETLPSLPPPPSSSRA